MKDIRPYHCLLGRCLLIRTKVAELQEHHSSNISGEEITDDEFTSRNYSVRIITVGREEDEEDDAQGSMVPQ